jgi:hypothetical protein
MWTMFLLWACGSNRFSDAPRSVERTIPWSELELPADGRTVSSRPDGLVVRYDSEDVGAIDGAWRAALEGAGFELGEDTSREALVSCTWTQGEQTLALSVSAMRGSTTVSLQEVR